MYNQEQLKLLNTERITKLMDIEALAWNIQKFDLGRKIYSSATGYQPVPL